MFTPLAARNKFLLDNPMAFSTLDLCFVVLVKTSEIPRSSPDMWM
jgi:hypothetical protein